MPTNCSRCEGIITEDREWDLPSGIREYYCLNCGDHFWLNLQAANVIPGLLFFSQN